MELDETEDALSAFLAHAALEAGEDGSDPGQDCVQLMTLHSAKGLEFPVVHIVGMEEGLLPTSRALEDPVKLEEERRLCYVGITRARSRLCLSHAERRRMYGQDAPARKSRFLYEVPEDLLTDLRPKAHVSRPLTARAVPLAAALEETGIFPPGARVAHPRFGEGMVLRYEGSGSHLRVHVNFREHGSKCLVMSYAKLESLD